MWLLLVTSAWFPICQKNPLPGENKQYEETLGFVLWALQSKAKFTFTSLMGTGNLSHQINPNKQQQLIGSLMYFPLSSPTFL